LDGHLYKGASSEGWDAFIVKKGDLSPKLAFGRNYDGTGGIWFWGVLSPSWAILAILDRTQRVAFAPDALSEGVVVLWDTSGAREAREALMRRSKAWTRNLPLLV